MNTHGTGSDLRGMLLEVYKAAFGKLPQTFAETEEILREVVHQLSHHDWPSDLDTDKLLECLVIAREELKMDQFLSRQAQAWVETQLDSVSGSFNFRVPAHGLEVM